MHLHFHARWLVIEKKEYMNQIIYWKQIYVANVSMQSSSPHCRLCRLFVHYRFKIIVTNWMCQGKAKTLLCWHIDRITLVISLFYKKRTEVPPGQVVGGIIIKPARSLLEKTDWLLQWLSCITIKKKETNGRKWTTLSLISYKTDTFTHSYEHTV